MEAALGTRAASQPRLLQKPGLKSVTPENTRSPPNKACLSHGRTCVKNALLVREFSCRPTDSRTTRTWSSPSPTSSRGRLLSIRASASDLGGSQEKPLSQARASGPSSRELAQSTKAALAAAGAPSTESRGQSQAPGHADSHFQKHWDFTSKKDTAAEERVPGAAPARTLGKFRSVPITVHGCTTEEEATWLVEQVGALDGVHEVAARGVRAARLRGGSVQLQLQLESCVRIPALLDQVHALEERLLALPFRSHSWMWRGHRINYAVAGCGKPVILVHGFGGSAGHFRNLIAHLAHDHKVYAVDLLGFGDSDKPADVAYGPELWADIINDFALEFTDEPPILVGNSIGSLTALTAATQLVQRPSSLRGLILLNVAGGMNRKGLMDDDWLLRALSPIFIAIEYLLQKPSVASFLFKRFRNKANIRKILADQVYLNNPSVVDDRLVDILCEPALDPGALDVFVRVFTGEPGPRPEQLVERLDIPMLVLWGDADPWTPINGKVAQLFRQLEAERDNVAVVPLPGVGHCPHDDRPDLVASHILPWINSLDSAEL